MIKKFWRKKVIFLAALAIISIFGVISLIKAKTEPSTVSTAKVTVGTIKEVVTVTGFVKASRKASLSYGATSSRISWINAKVGDKVTTGTAILALDQTTLLSEVTAAEAAVSQAKAAYESAKAGEIIAFETYNNIRYEDSARIEALKKQAYETARSTDDGVTKAQMALNEAKNNLAKNVLVSPISGTITKLNANLGEIPTGTVSEIVDFDSFYFDVLIDELDIGKIKVGQNATVKLDSSKEKELLGQVLEIMPTTAKDGSNNTVIEIRIGLPQETGLLILPGMDGESTIVINERNDILTVPFEAVVSDGNNLVVWRVVDGKAVKTAVSKGLEGDLETEITSGLNAGDEVILNPLKTLKDGQSVKSK